VAVAASAVQPSSLSLQKKPHFDLPHFVCVLQKNSKNTKAASIG